MDDLRSMEYWDLDHQDRNYRMNSVSKYEIMRFGNYTLNTSMKIALLPV